MAEDNSALSPGTAPARSSPPPSATPAAGGSSTSFSHPHPAGHAFRRAITVDDASPFRRRPFMSHHQNPSSSTEAAVAGGFPPVTSSSAAFELPRRRSSNISDYSLSEARRSLRDELLNPRPAGVKVADAHEEPGWSSFPLAFALLPAVAGMVFKNGSAVVTDVMLLGLSAIFLHWSVTQPW